ncbi:MAG: hypothetical protein U0838_05740 [Chloroflexota bacterium]
MANDPSGTEWSVLVIREGHRARAPRPVRLRRGRVRRRGAHARDDFDPVADRVFEVVRARSGQVDVQAYPERFYALREEG